jgi:pimeloyl-ACP methyl ester carboxylesterase
MGVSGKIFAKVRIEGRPLRVIEWLEPHRRETIQNYAARMAELIDADGPVDLMGLSFGGIIAVEIARIRPVRHIFLISSIKSKVEKPFFFKVMRVAPFYITNTRFMRDRTIWIWGRFFGLNSKKQIEHFYRVMPDLSDRYHRWSVRQICKWKNVEVPVPITHIHGKKDRVFPLRSCDPCHVIPNADHAMIVTHAKEVSRLIHAKLQNRYIGEDFSSQTQA